MDSSKTDHTITLLKQYVVKEKVSLSELCYITDDFYDSLPPRDGLSLDSRHLNYTKDLLNEFVRIRHSKIVQFASLLKSGDIIEKNMSDEEKNLFFMMAVLY